MVEKAVTFGILFVFFVILIAAMIEYFIPLAVYPDFMIDCRGTLLKMESDGGLSDTDKLTLKSKIEDRGFTNVTITATETAKFGEELILTVECNYSYSKITTLFSRSASVQHITYKKTTLSRKVIN